MPLFSEEERVHSGHDTFWKVSFCCEQVTLPFICGLVKRMKQGKTQKECLFWSLVRRPVCAEYSPRSYWDEIPHGLDLPLARLPPQACEKTQALSALHYENNIAI
jgi:hypothetical protein